MANPVKVFVSYSWKEEEQTGVVDELERLCHPRNIQLIRDKNEMQHGELIRDFMDRMSGGEHIITIFSDAYFRSTWCMYELWITWQKGNFKDRTHPMVVDAIDLQNTDYRIAVTDFWKEKYEATESSLKGRDPAVFIDEHKRVKHYRDYYQNINELLNFAAGRLTTPLDQLKAQQYSQILNKISPLKKGIKDFIEPNESNSASRDEEKTTRTTPKFHEKYIQIIQKHIADALSVDAMAVCKQILYGELNKVLVMLEREQIECDAKEIAENLVVALQLGGKNCPVINKVLTNTIIMCLDKEKGGQTFEKSIPYQKNIIDKIEQILGYLVLSLVDENDARDVSGWLNDDLDGFYFELRVRTLGGVELFIARQQERKAAVTFDGHKITGKHLIFIDTNPLSWHEQVRLNEVKRIIWNTVMDDEREQFLDEDDLESLKAKINTLREIEHDPKKYCVAIKFEDGGDDSYQKICENFLMQLEIPMVRFGIKDKDVTQSSFGGIEFNLMSAIEEFLKTINKYT